MPHAPRFRTLSAALLVLGLTAGALGTTVAPASSARAAETEAEEAPPASLIVAPREPVLEAEASELEVTVVIRNPGTEELPGGRVALRFGTEPVADVAGLTPESPARGPLIAEANVGATAPGEDRSTTLTVRRDRLPLAADAPLGTHLLSVELAPEPPADEDTAPLDGDDAANLTASTPIVWRGTDASPPTVPLGVIVPLVLPAEVHTLPTRGQLESLTPGWDRLVTEARRAQATLAIDPRIISGIRAYGTGAPNNARDFLERLSSLTLPTFLLQFADADPSAQAALGFSRLLSPTSLDFVSRFGTFTAEPEEEAVEGREDDRDQESEGDAKTGAEEAPADSPARPAQGAPAEAPASDPTPAPHAPEGPEERAEDAVGSILPPLGELLSWPDALPAAWPAEGAVDQATLDLLETSGLSTVVLDSSNVTGVPAPRAPMGAGSALITDAELDAAAAAALGAETAPERAAGAAQLAARLALAAQSSTPGLLIGLDRGAVADAEDPSTLLEQLNEYDWVISTPVADLPSGKVTLRAADTLDERRELLRSAASRESSVNAIGAVLVHPEYLSGYQRTRLLELFATRFATDHADFPATAAAYRERDAELLTGVRAISTEHTQLVGTSTRVPVQLQNALPFDAVVEVRVEPSSAALSITERSYPAVEVAAEANQRILVPVHSRVSSGESGLIVSVAAASGEPTVFTGTLPISIRSSVETIGLWVLGGLAALLLGFGIWRSLRRAQRAGGGAVDSERSAPATGPRADADHSLSAADPEQE